MSFAGTDFLPFLGLALFLFPFLPARLRPHGMLALSYAFYAAHTPWHLAVLVVSTALDYFVGLALGRAKGTAARRGLLATSVVGNLALLIAFKYTGGVGLALGLSFYTFQSLSYSIDVYRRALPPCTRPLEFALFVAFFPQLLAGPIERARTLMPQLRALEPAGRVALEAGARLILWGLWKKLCLADRFRPGLVEQALAPEGLDVVTMCQVAIGLNVVLYLDFSAYTDIARGSARLFGVHLVKNFNCPYLATSVGDFTRRWHMSLIDWITDYVWMPLLRSRPGVVRLVVVNTFVMLLFALWHDARWAYLPPGLALAFFISVEQIGRLRRLRKGIRRTPRTARPERGIVPGGAAVFMRWSTWRSLSGWALALGCWSAFAVTMVAPDTAAIMAFGDQVLACESPTLTTLRACLPLAALMVTGLALQWLSTRVDMLGSWGRVAGLFRACVLILGGLVIARYQASGSQDFTYFQF